MVRKKRRIDTHNLTSCVGLTRLPSISRKVLASGEQIIYGGHGRQGDRTEVGEIVF